MDKGSKAKGWRCTDQGIIILKKSKPVCLNRGDKQLLVCFVLFFSF